MRWKQSSRTHAQNGQRMLFQFPSHLARMPELPSTKNSLRGPLQCTLAASSFGRMLVTGHVEPKLSTRQASPLSAIVGLRGSRAESLKPFPHGNTEPQPVRKRTGGATLVPHPGSLSVVAASADEDETGESLENAVTDMSFLGDGGGLMQLTNSVSKVLECG